MLAVSPWRLPMPRSQYQWAPTLGGSPATAGREGKAAANPVAAAAARAGACPGCERKAGAAKQKTAASSARLSSCDALLEVIFLSAP